MGNDKDDLNAIALTLKYDEYKHSGKYMVKWYFNGYKMCILHYQLILMLMRNSTTSQQISKHNQFILSKTMEYLAQQATIWHLLSVNNCSQMFLPKSHVQFKTRF
jgi:hypothetical protein